MDRFHEEKANRLLKNKIKIQRVRADSFSRNPGKPLQSRNLDTHTHTRIAVVKWLYSSQYKKNLRQRQSHSCSPTSRSSSPVTPDFTKPERTGERGRLRRKRLVSTKPRSSDVTPHQKNALKAASALSSQCDETPPPVTLCRVKAFGDGPL